MLFDIQRPLGSLLGLLQLSAEIRWRTQRQMPQSRGCDAVGSPSSHLGGKLGEVAAPGSHNQVPAEISDGSNDQMYEQKQTASTDRLA